MEVTLLLLNVLSRAGLLHIKEGMYMLFCAMESKYVNNFAYRNSQKNEYWRMRTYCFSGVY